MSIKKPIVLPPIIIDTREQKPFEFQSATVREKLDIGDYSLRGMTKHFAIERKELNDLIGCMISKEGNRNRDRFERELERARTCLRRLWIICEGDWKEIIRGSYRSEIKIASVVATLLAWINRFNVSILFAGGRKEANRLAYLVLERSYIDYIEKKLPEYKTPEIPNLITKN